jgi:predicted Fe-Mo cluster-binding NifX family protein
MNLCFAFAVSENNQFEKKHFGDADKYLIYKQDGDEIKLFSEEINKFKLLDEEIEHGSKKKGEAIIQFLKERNVNVLVSRQFGKNINRVNNHFIPVKISVDRPDDILDVLVKNLHWIEDELNNNTNEYKLFIIKSGILKMPVKKYTL